MNTKLIAKKNTSGFSLVEMLVVIAVIGIIAAIAVPNIGRINDAAEEAKSKRNAQNLASVYASAQAAGLDFLVSGNEGNTIAKVVTGATVSAAGSPFNGTFFGVPNLSSLEQGRAGTFLDLTADGMLVYLPGGGT